MLPCGDCGSINGTSPTCPGWRCAPLGHRGLVPEARARARTLGALVLTHVLGYAFFYFDGNYPGGGARLFVDVMPLEHVLLGVAFTQLNVARFVPGSLLLGLRAVGRGST